MEKRGEREGESASLPVSEERKNGGTKWRKRASERSFFLHFFSSLARSGENNEKRKMSSSNAPGPPLLSLVLTALPSPNVDDGARSRLWMCPLDMHDARLRSGATVALMRDSTHAAAATATTATASANGQGLCRQTLWPLSPSSSSSSSSSPAPSPGCSVVLADAWPGPKVPRGRASPSRALAASLGLLRVSAAEGGRRNRGGRSSSSSPPAPSPLPTTDGVAVSLLAPPPPPPDANGEGDEEAAELVLRPLEEGGEEEATERDRTTILGPRQRAALSALAARRASGRRFLRGNVIVIPLLGRDAPFEVVKVVVSGSNVSRSLSGWEEAKVGARTRVRVFGGGENGGNDDDDENSDSEGKEDEDDAEARASSSSASAALRYDDEGDPLFAAAAFAAARAAEKAIGGGHSGPAASAAAAAAAAGAHALHGALSRARAAAAKNGDDYSSKSSDGFAPLGGVEALSKRLRDLVTLPLSNPGVFALYGLRAPAGAVLHGPPGTGKTALATAAAADAALALMARAEKKEKDKNKKRNGKSEENTLVSLFVVGGAEVVRSAAGASEEGLRGVFAAARAAPGPSVVFLDEVDALAPARGKGGGGGGGGGGGSGATAPVKAAAASGASARLSAALAAELDAISNSASSSSSTRIVVLAATNRLDAVDHGLRRPGRLDAEVEVPPPGAGGRAAILRSYLCPSASSASSSSPSPPPAAGVLRRHSLTEKDVSCLAAAAHGFVGADLALLVREAASFALRRAVKNSSEKNRSGRGKPNGGGGAEAEAEAEEGIDLGSPDLVVSRDDFDAARRVVRPSAMRSVMLRLPRARWEDVGGQKVAKSRLQEALATRCSSSSSSSSSSSPTVSKNPALLGVAPPAGILLYGPPGCSKTLLARAAARESGRNLFAVRIGFFFLVSRPLESATKKLILSFSLRLSLPPFLSLSLSIQTGQSRRAPELLRRRLRARRGFLVQGSQGRLPFPRLLRRGRRLGHEARGGRRRRQHGLHRDQRGQREGRGAAAAGARRRGRARRQEQLVFFGC